MVLEVKARFYAKNHVFLCKKQKKLCRAGIEPPPCAWQANSLPMHHGANWEGGFGRVDKGRNTTWTQAGNSGPASEFMPFLSLIWTKNDFSTRSPQQIWKTGSESAKNSEQNKLGPIPKRQPE